MWGKMCDNSLIVKFITVRRVNGQFWCGRVDRFEVGGDGSLSIVNAKRAQLNLSSQSQDSSAARSHSLECLDDPFGLGVSQM